jgi:peptide/nickel transport system substrate-binding protein
MAILLLLITILSGTTIFTKAEEDTKERPIYGGTLHSATLNDPHTLNAMLTLAGDDWNFLEFMYSYLVSFKVGTEDYSEWTPIPDTCDSWEVSEDGLTWTFHINPNAKWSDGTPLTAEDVEFSYQTNYESHPFGLQNFEVMESVEATDDTTVVFKLKTTSGSFSEMWQFAYWGPIIPKHIYEGTDIVTNEYNWKPVTSGPFRFVEYVKGSHIMLERNPYYWKKDEWGNSLPYLDKVIIHIVPSYAVTVAGLLRGDFGYSGLPVADFQTVIDNEGTDIAVFYSPSACQDLWYMNLRNPIIGDLNVRKALAHVVEKYRDVLLEDARQGWGELCYSFVTPFGGSGWASISDDVKTDPEVPYYDGDMEVANQLLDDAGYPVGTDGKRFTLHHIVCNCRPEEVKMAEILRDVLDRELSIELDVRVMDNPVWITKTYVEWDFDTSMRTLCSGPDVNRLYGAYHSDSIRPQAWNNAFGYNNSYVDDLIVAAAEETDVEKRKEMYRDIQIQMLKDLPAIPIVQYAGGYAYNEEFVGPGAYLNMVDEGWSIYRWGEWSRTWWRGGEPVPLFEEPTPEPPVTEDLTPRVEALESDISDIKSDISDVKSGIESLTADVEELSQAGAPTTTNYVSYLAIIIAIIAVAFVQMRTSS